jgi:hypothetical protein
MFKATSWVIQSNKEQDGLLRSSCEFCIGRGFEAGLFEKCSNALDVDIVVVRGGWEEYGHTSTVVIDADECLADTPADLQSRTDK